MGKIKGIHSINDIPRWMLSTVFGGMSRADIEDKVLGPSGVVHAYGGDDNAILMVKELGNPFTVNVAVDRHGYFCPLGLNIELDLKGVWMSATIVPADADGTCLMDLETVTAAGVKADFETAATGFDLEAMTADVLAQAWLGRKLLTPGLGWNMEFSNTSAAIDTAAVGVTAHAVGRWGRAGFN